MVLADDVAEFRRLVRLSLERDPRFEVVGEAVDGKEALALVARFRPEVVLLDLAMPVMDGLQALPELRTHLPNARIVIFSGFEHEALAEEALLAGADAYIEKGTSVTQLVTQLRELRRPA